MDRRLTSSENRGWKFATNCQFQKIEHKFSKMTDRELLSFVNKFRELLSAGNLAKLVMECESGCARVNLEVMFNPDHGHPPQQEQHHHRQGQVHHRSGRPARLRRHVRRAQARQAADQAVKEQVKPDDSLPPLNADHHHRLHPDAEEAVYPQHSVEQAAHHHYPLHTVGEAAHHHLLHTVEQAAHHHPLHTVENAALCQPPNSAGEAVECLQVPHAAVDAVHCDVSSPLGRAAVEGFPPLSYILKEVFPPPAAPLQVSPVWPGHYQEYDDQGCVEVPHVHQVQPDHHPPCSLPLSSLTLSPTLPAHSQSQQLSACMTPAGQQSIDQGELFSNQKKKNRRKKRKSRTKNDEAEYDDLIHFL